VIAAQQKRLIRKVVAPLHRERAVAGEKLPAKTFKHSTANGWCPERTLRFLTAGHPVWIAV